LKTRSKRHKGEGIGERARHGVGWWPPGTCGHLEAERPQVCNISLQRSLRSAPEPIGAVAQGVKGLAAGGAGSEALVREVTKITRKQF